MKVHYEATVTETIEGVADLDGEMTADYLALGPAEREAWLAEYVEELALDGDGHTHREVTNSAWHVQETS